MITVITCTNRKGFLDNILGNYLSQRYLEKELIIIINKDGIDSKIYEKKISELENVTVYKLSEKLTLGECLNYAVEKAKYDYIAKFDDDDYYGPYYLVEAFKELTITNSPVIGKSSIYIYFHNQKILGKYNSRLENRYLNEREFLMGSTFVFKKGILEKIKFPHVNLGEDVQFQQLCKSKGIPLYSTSRMNYVYIRYDSPNHHTSDSSNNRLLRKCIELIHTNEFSVYVDSIVD
ncbi:glycosyltransferase [Oceanobacillus salinisoli]|uniref:glycosyltransferase n=1 Tax=Oceanobacillus salinisoli TaxID=2678611 RepID=UPI0012E1384C|nr:glycosyltransferase family A protein [Oceanobacillus salinisoli]